jgi:MOSC domain-containing protein YiiM
VATVHVEIGPYSFSGEDVRRTLQHADDLLAHPADAGPDRSHRRPRVASLLSGHDPLHDDVASLAPVLEAVWGEILSARDDLDELLPASQRGIVRQLSTSGGGLPKLAVERAEVGFRGLIGDTQKTRRHHGRPFQALCLWSVEVVDALAAEGHLIAAGSAGENITISGLDWPTLFPGVRIEIGEVLCEVTSYAVPCSQNRPWFSDGDVSRIHHDNGDLSRLYATVLRPGLVATGDTVLLEPQPTERRDQSNVRVNDPSEP